MASENTDMREDLVAHGNLQQRATFPFEPTGVPGLDEVLGGGLQRGSLALLLGPPGSGKTTLASQMAFHMARGGRRVLIVTALSEAPTKLLSHLSNFSFFDREMIGDSVQAFSLQRLTATSAQHLTESTEIIVEAARSLRAGYVMLDGFSGLRPEEVQEQGGRLFLYNLGTTLGALGITMVVTSVSDSAVSTNLGEATTADVIIGLRYATPAVHARRTLEAIKVRGAPQLTGLHGLSLSSEGISVWPRLEARIAALRRADRGGERELLPFQLEPGRAAFDLPELDRLLDGGITRGTGTLIAGSLGTGKTLLGLHFSAAGLRQGESTVYVSFEESREQLLLKARIFGLGDLLQEALADGRLVLDALDPVELDADETANRLLSAVDRVQAQRVVIDTISDLERVVAETGFDNRVDGFLVALLRALRGRGVTGIFIRPTAPFIATDVELSDTAVAALAENVLLLQQVRARNRLARALSVVKMSFSGHDTTVREITIAPDQGIRVLKPFESEPGVLSDLARIGNSTPPRTGRSTRGRHDG